MGRASVSDRDAVVAELLTLWNGPNSLTWTQCRERIAELEQWLKANAPKAKGEAPAVSANGEAVRIDRTLGELLDPPAPLVDTQDESLRADPFRRFAAESGQNTD